MVDGNPCIEYIKYITFPWFNQFEVTRDEKNGGNKTYLSMEDLVADYSSGALHPSRLSWPSLLDSESSIFATNLAGDVKPALAKSLNLILQPGVLSELLYFFLFLLVSWRTIDPPPCMQSETTLRTMPRPRSC